MKKKSIWAAGIALVMLLSVSLGSTLAYFTATAEADGSIPVALGAKTHLDETINNDLSKTITVSNDGESEVMVRVSVVGDYVTDVSGDNWTDGEDGYYYYNSILEPKSDDDSTKSTTASLTVQVDVTAAAQNGASFDIIVNEEAGQVVENEDGEVVVNWDGAAVSDADAAEEPEAVEEEVE